MSRQRAELFRAHRNRFQLQKRPECLQLRLGTDLEQRNKRKLRQRRAVHKPEHVLLQKQPRLVGKLPGQLARVGGRAQPGLRRPGGAGRGRERAAAHREFGPPPEPELVRVLVVGPVDDHGLRELQPGQRQLIHRHRRHPRRDQLLHHVRELRRHDFRERLLLRLNRRRLVQRHSAHHREHDRPADDGAGGAAEHDELRGRFWTSGRDERPDDQQLQPAEEEEPADGGERRGDGEEHELLPQLVPGERGERREQGVRADVVHLGAAEERFEQPHVGIAGHSDGDEPLERA